MILDPEHPMWPVFEAAVDLAEAGETEGAVTMFTPLAEAGDPCSQTWLADALDELDRPLEAIRWYRRAVRAGWSAAALNLAVLHRNRNRRRDYVRWLRHAAAMGDPEAPVLIETATGQHHAWWAIEGVSPPPFVGRPRLVQP